MVELESVPQPAQSTQAGCSGRAAGIFVLLFASVFGGFGGFMVAKERRVAATYRAAECTVLEKGVESHSSSDGGTTYSPRIRYRYEVAGRVYESSRYDAIGASSSGYASKQAIVDRYAEGQTYTCWYDPASPADAVWVKQTTVFPWIFTGIGAVVGLGGLALVFGAGRGKKKDAVAGEAAVRSNDLVPQPRKPGPVTLSSGLSPFGAAVGLGIFALLWNGFVWGIALAVYHTENGRPPVVGMVFFSLFALVGLGVIVALVRQIRVAFRFHPPTLQLDRHPLAPGDTVRVRFEQEVKDDVEIDVVKIQLSCEETAIYRRGTNTVTVKQTVWAESEDTLEGERVMAGDSIHWQGSFTVPAEAMHTFRASHNKVLWKFDVKVDAAGWADTESEFEVEVMPVAPTAS